MGEEPGARRRESRLWTANLRHPTLLCGLTMEREALYERIDARVDAMVAAGAAAEVARADAAGAGPTARAALGFEELLGGDVRGDEAPHAQLREAPARLDAPPSGTSMRSTSTDREPEDAAPRSPIYCARPGRRSIKEERDR